MGAAAISGDYVDLKFVKGRGVAVILVEIPIEAASGFVEAFGTPMPGTGVPLALARLMPPKQAQQVDEPAKERRKFGDLPLPQQAALLGSQQAFWTYLRERHGYHAATPDDGAEAIREICHVDSRSKLREGTPAGADFLTLKGNFDVWMRAVA